MIKSFVKYYIRCDDCNELLTDPRNENDTFDSIKEALNILKLAGWYSLKKENRHFCPSCRRQRLINEYT